MCAALGLWLASVLMPLAPILMSNWPRAGWNYRVVAKSRDGRDASTTLGDDVDDARGPQKN